MVDPLSQEYKEKHVCKASKKDKGYVLYHRIFLKILVVGVKPILYLVLKAFNVDHSHRRHPKNDYKHDNGCCGCGPLYCSDTLRASFFEIFCTWLDQWCLLILLSFYAFLLTVCSSFLLVGKALWRRLSFYPVILLSSSCRRGSDLLILLI